MSREWVKSDFGYELPAELIAQIPPESRAGGRLLVPGSRGVCADREITDLPELLNEGDLLVFNDTRVIPARLRGRKESGGAVEVLIERLLPDDSIVAQVRASKSPKTGTRLLLEDAQLQVDVLGRDGAFFLLRFPDEADALTALEQYGHIPLPPYIERADAEADKERYQTVFAKTPGAVAAPTAGLHFDESLLENIRSRGVATTTLTLHVGAGTFSPMRCEQLSEHQMHAERFRITQQLADQVNQTRQRGGRVVAVGTTSARALEASASASGEVSAMESETELFITPGYQFRAVDVLITNFHLPESTLMMLVCAFGGYERLMAAYEYAVQQEYRFFSYGDAMFLTPENTAAA